MHYPCSEVLRFYKLKYQYLEVLKYVKFLLKPYSIPTKPWLRCSSWRTTLETCPPITSPSCVSAYSLCQWRRGKRMKRRSLERVGPQTERRFCVTWYTSGMCGVSIAWCILKINVACLFFRNNSFVFISRFQSSKSGKIYLHNDIRLLFSRKSIEVDTGIPYKLKSFTEVPRNPKYSPRVWTPASPCPETNAAPPPFRRNRGTDWLFKTWTHTHTCLKSQVFFFYLSGSQNNTRSDWALKFLRQDNVSTWHNITYTEHN